MAGVLAGRLPNGNKVRSYTIGRSPGAVAEVLDLGASVQSLWVDCGDGMRRNVALGHHSVAARYAATDYRGGTIGRYANRLRGGRFWLDGSEVVVPTNDRGNCLHGGTVGFDRRLWRVVEHKPDVIALGLTSNHLDMGFPGGVCCRFG